MERQSAEVVKVVDCQQLEVFLLADAVPLNNQLERLEAIRSFKSVLSKNFLLAKCVFEGEKHWLSRVSVLALSELCSHECFNSRFVGLQRMVLKNKRQSWEQS